MTLSPTLTLATHCRCRRHLSVAAFRLSSTNLRPPDWLPLLYPTLDLSRCCRRLSAAPLPGSTSPPPLGGNPVSNPLHRLSVTPQADATSTPGGASTPLDCLASSLYFGSFARLHAVASSAPPVRLECLPPPLLCPVARRRLLFFARLSHYCRRPLGLSLSTLTTDGYSRWLLRHLAPPCLVRYDKLPRVGYSLEDSAQ